LKKDQAIKDEKIKQLEKNLKQCLQGKTNLNKIGDLLTDFQCILKFSMTGSDKGDLVIKKIA
jgi:hypothetical protein